MNILYLADPNSIHDLKWITTLSSSVNRVFLLPRKIHSSNVTLPGVTVFQEVHDFSIVRFYRTLMEAHRIKKLVKENKIEVIHILYAEPNALWCFFRGYFNVPMIISTRGTDVLKTIPSFFERFSLINLLVAPLYKFSFKRADKITATSVAQMESIQKFSGRTIKVLIVRTGVNLRLIESLKGSSSHLGKQQFILFPRLMRPIYNHEFCLDAIQLLSPSTKQTYSMVFVGKNGGDRAYQEFIEEQMKQISLVNFIFLETQNQEELIKLYYNASLVVMTPKSDGSPVSAMEAFLCDAKVVLGPLEYDDEVFSSARKISKWDAQELASVIEESLVQKHAVQEKSSEMKQLMDTEYNMAKIKQIYKDLTK